jgi:hypothetical protein
VLACLRNKAYAASIAYRRKIARKTSRRGQTAGQWIHTPKARDWIISQEQFQWAQEMLA